MLAGGVGETRLRRADHFQQAEVQVGDRRAGLEPEASSKTARGRLPGVVTEWVASNGASLRSRNSRRARSVASARPVVNCRPQRRGSAFHIRCCGADRVATLRERNGTFLNCGRRSVPSAVEMDGCGVGESSAPRHHVSGVRRLPASNRNGRGVCRLHQQRRPDSKGSGVAYRVRREARHDTTRLSARWPHRSVSAGPTRATLSQTEWVSGR